MNKIRVHESFICSAITTYLKCRLFDMADSARVQEAVARLLGAVARVDYPFHSCHDARVLDVVARALEEVARVQDPSVKVRYYS